MSKAKSRAGSDPCLNCREAINSLSSSAILCRLEFDYPYQSPELDEEGECKEYMAGEPFTKASDMIGPKEPPGECFSEKGHPKPYELARHFVMERNVYKTLKDTEEILFYDWKAGYYKRGGEVTIKGEVELSLGEKVKTHTVNEIIGHVQRGTYIDREAFHPPIHLLNLKNGILNLLTGELTEHTPCHLTMVQIPLVYDSKAIPHRFLKFLEEILPKKERMTIVELFGYSLWKDYPLPKSFMFVGEGRNGKSTLLNVLRTFVGDENCAHVPLQNLGRRFAPAELYRKLLNVEADLSSEALQRTSLFKKLTGEDRITAEKKHKDPFSFLNYAKLVFSCNKIPETPDETEAFWERWIILVFNQKFLGEKADIELIDKLTTEEELSGILNMAIPALRDLLKKKEFSNSMTTDQIASLYQRMSDSIKAFIEDRVEWIKGEIVSRDRAYNEFVNYCNDNRLPNTGKRKFFQKIRETGNLSGEPKKSFGRTRLFCFEGMHLLTKEEEEEKDGARLEEFI